MQENEYITLGNDFYQYRGYCRGVTRPVAVGENRLIGMPSSSVALSQPSKAVLTVGGVEVRPQVHRKAGNGGRVGVGVTTASPAELGLCGVPLLRSNCSNTVSQ